MRATRAPVVAVGRGAQRQRPHPLRQRDERLVGRHAVEALARPGDQCPVHRPRRAEDLERRQTQAGRLVLDEHLRHTEPLGAARRAAQRRGGVARHAAVEPPRGVRRGRESMPPSRGRSSDPRSGRSSDGAPASPRGSARASSAAASAARRSASWIAAGQRRRRRADRRLADAAGAQRALAGVASRARSSRMSGRSSDGGDQVVGEQRRACRTPVVDLDLLGQRVADALGDGALDLALRRAACRSPGRRRGRRRSAATRTSPVSSSTSTSAACAP